MARKRGAAAERIHARFQPVIAGVTFTGGRGDVT